MSPSPRSRRSALVAVVVAALVGGLFGVIPVRSQTLRLDALLTEETVPVDDPWAPVWDTSRVQRVPLSAQNVAPPFGGGTVPALTARALHDEQRIYLLLEWNDDEISDSVTGNTEFSDAAAVQFPSTEADDIPPYTMGAPDAPVNIWQWKAVWQSDLDEGFAGAPDTGLDFYPDPDDTVFNPARHLGNPLAQVDHASPVEDLIAEGFGSLTSAAGQNVDGSGVWRDATWRAVFARDLEPDQEGAAGFAVGESTMVAFAVWDGHQGDRNGQKSIAQFIELELVARAAPPVVPGALPSQEPSGTNWYPALIMLLAVAVVFFGLEWIMRRTSND